jgi:hypothetical protein
MQTKRERGGQRERERERERGGGERKRERERERERDREREREGRKEGIYSDFKIMGKGHKKVLLHVGIDPKLRWLPSLTSLLVYMYL